MIKWLCKSTNEVRVETKTDVEVLNKELQETADNLGVTLSNFSWVEKTKKSKGEVLDSWFLVKYTYLFNDQKEPENPFTNVEYKKIENNAWGE